MEFTSRIKSKTVIKAIAPFISRNSMVLDIGCGNGVVSSEIKQYFNCQLVGTDILNYSKIDIDFRQMVQGDRLDFATNEFDVGLFIDMLHHVSFETQLKLINEALRVCPMVLLFEVKATFLAKIVDYLINQLHNREMPILLTHRKKNDWIRLFQENDIDFRYYDVKRPLLGLFPFTYYLFCLTKPKREAVV